jgi:hypothetical protein
MAKKGDELEKAEAGPIVLNTPREILRALYLEEIKELDTIQEEVDGVVGEGAEELVSLEHVLAIINQPLPPIGDHGAEVSTPARVVVWATCPRCGVPGALSAFLTAELRVDDGGGSLNLKAKSKGTNHVCNQTVWGLPVVQAIAEADGQEELPLDDDGEDGA